MGSRLEDFASIPPGFTNVTVLRCHVLDGYDNLPRGGLSPRLPFRHGEYKEDATAINPLLIPPHRHPQSSSFLYKTRQQCLVALWTQQPTGSGEGTILGRKYKSFVLVDPPYDCILDGCSAPASPDRTRTFLIYLLFSSTWLWLWMWAPWFGLGFSVM